MDDLSKGVHKVLPKSPIDSNFIEWFIGLCEAESNFLIRTRKNEKGEVGGFEFVFAFCTDILLWKSLVNNKVIQSNPFKSIFFFYTGFKI